MYRGQEMTVAEARRAAGSVISYAVAASRLKKGWTAEEAFETPPDPSVRNKLNPHEVANDAQIAITIPRAVRDKISALATQNGTTPSGYVRDVILRHLNLAEALP